FGNAVYVPSAFHDSGRDQGDGFGVVQLQATRFASFGQQGGSEDQQFVLLAGGQIHVGFLAERQVFQSRNAAPGVRITRGRNCIHRAMSSCLTCCTCSPRTRSRLSPCPAFWGSCVMPARRVCVHGREEASASMCSLLSAGPNAHRVAMTGKSASPF